MTEPLQNQSPYRLPMQRLPRFYVVTACLVHIMMCSLTISIAGATSSEQPWPTMGSSQYDMHKVVSKSQLRQRAIHQRETTQTSRSRHIVDITTCPTSCRCNFFLWDFISYFKYYETLTQAKQNTFEGKGGKKFVRIQPNTLLERWYPELKMNKLKPGGCFLCGYSWSDHLEYWWHCKRIKRQGGMIAFEKCIEGSDADHPTNNFAFHKRYVDEVNHGKNKKRWFHRNNKQLEIRRSSNGEISYLVPPFDEMADGQPKKIGSILLLALARITSLVRVEGLIWLRSVELSRLKLGRD